MLAAHFALRSASKAYAQAGLILSPSVFKGRTPKQRVRALRTLKYLVHLLSVGETESKATKETKGTKETAAFTSPPTSVPCSSSLSPSPPSSSFSSSPSLLSRQYSRPVSSLPSHFVYSSQLERRPRRLWLSTEDLFHLDTSVLSSLEERDHWALLRALLFSPTFLKPIQEMDWVPQGCFISNLHQNGMLGCLCDRIKVTEETRFNTDEGRDSDNVGGFHAKTRSSGMSGSRRYNSSNMSLSERSDGSEVITLTAASLEALVTDLRVLSQHPKGLQLLDANLILFLGKMYARQERGFDGPRGPSFHASAADVDGLTDTQTLINHQPQTKDEIQTQTQTRRQLDNVRLGGAYIRALLMLSEWELSSSPPNQMALKEASLGLVASPSWGTMSGHGGVVSAGEQAYLFLEEVALSIVSSYHHALAKLVPVLDWLQQDQQKDLSSKIKKMLAYKASVAKIWADALLFLFKRGYLEEEGVKWTLLAAPGRMHSAARLHVLGRNQGVDHEHFQQTFSALIRPGSSPLSQAQLHLLTQLLEVRKIVCRFGRSGGISAMACLA